MSCRRETNGYVSKVESESNILTGRPSYTPGKKYGFARGCLVMGILCVFLTVIVQAWNLGKESGYTAAMNAVRMESNAQEERRESEPRAYSDSEDDDSGALEEFKNRLWDQVTPDEGQTIECAYGTLTIPSGWEHNEALSSEAVDVFSEPEMNEKNAQGYMEVYWINTPVRAYEEERFINYILKQIYLETGIWEDEVYVYTYGDYPATNYCFEYYLISEDGEWIYQCQYYTIYDQAALCIRATDFYNCEEVCAADAGERAMQSFRLKMLE